MQQDFQRLNVELNVELYYAKRGFRLICVCRNLSETGMYIHTREPAAVNSELEYTFELAPGVGPFRGQATVCWVMARETLPGNRATYGMGIEFLTLHPEAKNWIHNALAHEQANRPASTRNALIVQGELNLATDEAFAVHALYDSLLANLDAETEEQPDEATDESSESDEHQPEPAEPQEDTEVQSEEPVAHSLREDPTESPTESPGEATDSDSDSHNETPTALSLLIDLRSSHAAEIRILQQGSIDSISITPRIRRGEAGLYTSAQGIRLPMSVVLSETPDAVCRRLHAMGHVSELLAAGDDPLAISRAFFEEVATHLAHRPEEMPITVLTPMDRTQFVHDVMGSILSEGRMEKINFESELLHLVATHELSDEILVLHLGTYETRLGWFNREGPTDLKTLELLGRVQVVDAMMPGLESTLREEHCIDTEEDPLLMDAVREQIQGLQDQTSVTLLTGEIELVLTPSELELAAYESTQMLVDEIRRVSQTPDDLSEIAFLVVEEEAPWPGLMQKLDKEFGLVPHCIKLTTPAPKP